MTDRELTESAQEKKVIFSVKGLNQFKEGDTEIYVDELTRIQNTEAVFSDKYVQVFFSEDGLFDPTLFDVSSLEEAPLGSYASYRNKIMVRNFTVSEF